jgi:hypothetical protein
MNIGRLAKGFRMRNSETVIERIIISMNLNVHGNIYNFQHEYPDVTAQSGTLWIPTFCSHTIYEKFIDKQIVFAAFQRIADDSTLYAKGRIYTFSCSTSKEPPVKK